MKKTLILFLLFLATMAVACLYRYPVDLDWNIPIACSPKVSHKSMNSKDKISSQALQEPPVPQWPLAEVDTAEPKDYSDIQGASVYHLLEGTPLGWTRKVNDNIEQGTVLVSQGKVAVQKGKIVAGLFMFDLNTLQMTGKSDEKLVSYLKSDKYFDVEKYPHATLVLQGLDGNILSGILKIKDISKKISFPALVLMRKDSIKIYSDFSLEREAFGLPMAPGVDPFFDIHIQRTLRK